MIFGGKVGFGSTATIRPRAGSKANQVPTHKCKKTKTNLTTKYTKYTKQKLLISASNDFSN
jgi:hypothetical protein